MWIDAYEFGRIPPPHDITPKPPLQFEARAIVWRCRGVEAGDVEGVGDLYVRVLVNDCKP